MMYSAKAIDSSDAFPALLSEAELDGVAGGAIKQDPGKETPPPPYGNGSGDDFAFRPWADQLRPPGSF